ncbi:hypothetical protein CC85DRAFT_111250 [Cutaneotrichosporon oleaginosum]|uniref:Uncharacterized protein n=1 Tax=Cutaneotrichosporon oleaginosum TaxID=879819 RepID=A0A0J0XX42_9TREE|nr:uncharacterized protein CC85DRAFT_111250 [Cutaneotrichosporon oleaginosum]KLT45608.1 hypothetical protein CC85DRAFT_111250 [Cutaneotrichosporon oleaginosum]TXT04595.1 hypothetical protein COLE_07414 [Cutaneotrichosporon oleaginosum]
MFSGANSCSWQPRATGSSRIRPALPLGMPLVSDKDHAIIPDSSRAGVATLALSTLGTNQTAAQPLHAKTWASGTHARSMVAPFDCSARLLACDTSYRAFEGGGHACRNSGRQLWKSSSASRRVSSSTRAAGQCCIPSASSVMSWYGFGGASDRWSKAHPQAQVHTQPLRWRDGLGSHLSLEDATRGCCLLAHAH